MQCLQSIALHLHETSLPALGDVICDHTRAPTFGSLLQEIMAIESGSNKRQKPFPDLQSAGIDGDATREAMGDQVPTCGKGDVSCFPDDALGAILPQAS